MKRSELNFQRLSLEKIYGNETQNTSQKNALNQGVEQSLALSIAIVQAETSADCATAMRSCWHRFLERL